MAKYSERFFFLIKLQNKYFQLRSLKLTIKNKKKTGVLRILSKNIKGSDTTYFFGSSSKLVCVIKKKKVILWHPKVKGVDIIMSIIYK